MDSAARRPVIVWALHDRHALSSGAAGARANWLAAIRRYLVATAIGNLVWETAQLPLYSLWRTGTPNEIAAALFHCWLGDVVIAAVVLVLALALFAAPAWPREKFRPVLGAVLAGSVGYTIYSEYVNAVLRTSWTYSSWMPTLPVLGTGLAPLAQWVVVPVLAITWAARRRRRPALSAEDGNR